MSISHFTGTSSRIWGASAISLLTRWYSHNAQAAAGDAEDEAQDVEMWREHHDPRGIERPDYRLPDVAELERLRAGEEG
ncbi:hypothetical protein [Sphaerisporangium sp. NPDC051011]|uniref:hypothetical protein n=1 Tax=Sphaerisporangium sp. NPDC051011 TaxID=3155792 RepID=UPI0033DD334B